MKVDERTTLAVARSESAGGGVAGPHDGRTRASCLAARSRRPVAGLTMAGRARVFAAGSPGVLLRAAARPAAALARHRLPRVAVDAAAAELLCDRRVHGPHRAGVHARDVPAAAHATRAHRHHRAHAADGGRRHPDCGGHRVSGGAVHGALRGAADQGALLRGRDAADVDQLPRQGLCVAPDPRQAGHRELGLRAPRPHGVHWTRRWRCRSSADRRWPRRTSACSSCSSTCGCRS